MKKYTTKQNQGKRNRINGANFEKLVRKDLEEKGWIVDRWTNNIQDNKLIPAKSNRFNMRYTGFPDFLVYGINRKLYQVIGVECKVGKYLNKEEKEKCKWLLDNNIFGKILIAWKTKEGRKIKINYMDFEDYNKMKGGKK